MSKARSRWRRIFYHSVDGKTLCPAPERDSLEARAALLMHADAFTADMARRFEAVVTFVIKSVGLNLKVGKTTAGIRMNTSPLYSNMHDVEARIASEVLAVLIVQGYLASTATVTLVDRWSDCGIYDLTHACTSRCDGAYAGKQAIVRVNAQVRETKRETNSEKAYREKMEWLNKQ